MSYRSEMNVRRNKRTKSIRKEQINIPVRVRIVHAALKTPNECKNRTRNPTKNQSNN